MILYTLLLHRLDGQQLRSYVLVVEMRQKHQFYFQHPARPLANLMSHD